MAGFLLVASPVWGAVSGNIQDEKGAVIPGAMLPITNTAQGVQRKATTDVKGFYTFPSLLVGTYDIQAESTT
jgi:hypothetical protein